MTFPEWVKPGVYGAIVGAVAVTILGFTWGGWVTGGTADDMASEMAHDDVIAALVPVCVGMSQTDPDRIAQLAEIQSATSFRRRDAVMAAGWATIPGSETPNRDLAMACVAGLNLDAS